MAILESAASIRAGDLVFPSPTNRQISDSTISKLLREQGIPAVPHGFRSTFRDWASEMTDTPRAVMAAALAHSNKDKVEAAYARSDLFDPPPRPDGAVGGLPRQVGRSTMNMVCDVYEEKRRWRVVSRQYGYVAHTRTAAGAERAANRHMAAECQHIGSRLKGQQSVPVRCTIAWHTATAIGALVAQAIVDASTDNPRAVAK